MLKPILPGFYTRPCDNMGTYIYLDHTFTRFKLYIKFLSQKNLLFLSFVSKIQVDSSSTFETVLKRFDKWLKEQVTPEQNFVIATDGLVVNQYLMVGQLSRFLGTVQLESIIQSLNSIQFERRGIIKPLHNLYIIDIV